ncbi:hypothetical protein MHH28_00215 [Paenibacillus sp. FSL K6-1217]
MKGDDDGLEGLALGLRGQFPGDALVIKINFEKVLTLKADFCII